jgi:hypothetical protein
MRHAILDIREALGEPRHDKRRERMIEGTYHPPDCIFDLVSMQNNS